MSAPECVFCQLLAGHGPAIWIARERQAAALLTLPEHSLAPGHTLVLSTAHVVGVQDVSSADLGAVVDLVQRVAVAMRDCLDATGVNVLNASGDGSEQSVPHLHFHVVPRWVNDGFTTWPTGVSNKHLDLEVADVLASAVVTDPI